MKTHRLLPILISALLFAVCGRCFALTPIQVVSKAEAKEMGMELQAQAQGSDHVRVTLELKKEGKLKTFSRVELWIQDGEKVLFTGSLKDDEFSGKPGCVVVAFTIDRSLLAKAGIHVVGTAGTEVIGGLERVNEVCYALEMKEHAPPGDPASDKFDLRFPTKDHLTASQLYQFINTTIGIDKVIGQFALLDVVVTIERDVPLVEIVIPNELADSAHPPHAIHAHLISATTEASSRKKGERLRIEGIIVDEGYGAYMIYLKKARLIK